MIGRRWYVPWLFLAPALVLVAVVLWGPLANTAVLAFTDARALGGGRFNGLANFTRIGTDADFWQALMNTVLYLLVVVPALVVLPLLLATLVFAKVPGIGAFRAVFYTPVVASMVVVGLIFSWLLRSDGIVNAVLVRLRVVAEPLPFLTDSTLLLVSCMAVTIWKGLGYYMVIYLAALANVPSDVIEAATVDGAGPARRFWSITVPTVRPTMVLVGTLAAISAAKVFAEIYVMSDGSGGPGGDAKSMVFYIREVGLGVDGEIGYASALSLVLLAGTLVFSALSLRLRRRTGEGASA
ncbi:sugar ABC transporter permease [Dactylosporangium aurantiacum]|uniref:Sugar ABC transporter permease n=1 Tax=Dactylosporangium aurantiacum TaxID=35754 RepID=A0A9Q9IER0_9ACTN|nr:sugar ABC transporter permease [Dactylosporangium aurantiacum]MDG6103423.1 sugar ABC transporter permease [Dactylosporangium aurantiacum]UWZ52069.1 sugar ABC transporter permease [Dactylosporangium aurantiacum]